MAPSDSRAAECEVLIVDTESVASVLAALPSRALAQEACAIFDALSDPTRLRMLLALATAGELCVCDIAEVADVSPSAVSHQLRLLRDRDLVAYRREGKRAVYRLADSHVRSLLDQGLEHAAESRGSGAGK